jgi:hypothetical protein
MNVYANRGQARIRPRDVSAVLRANQLAGAPLAGLERQRRCQAEAELTWLLQRHGSTPKGAASRGALLRQAIGTVLVRIGARLAGVPQTGAAREPVTAPGPVGTAS